MRRTFSLLASVKPARYLEPGTPTGLTGLWTHNSPRSTLLYLYSSTLDKLQAFPESSLYRQSVEALTKHRMTLVEATVPPGYSEWEAKTKKQLADKPDLFRIVSGRSDGSKVQKVKVGSRTFVVGQRHASPDIRYEDPTGSDESIDHVVRIKLGEGEWQKRVDEIIASRPLEFKPDSSGKLSLEQYVFCG
jgi:NADH dehydrogenase (ubiquinone) 1 alpha subcomplex subunit 5